MATTSWPSLKSSREEILISINVEEKACFVRRVNRGLEKHLGTTTDELRITCDLERSSQSHVDKWVATALDKQVKTLELNLSPIWRKLPLRDDRFYQDNDISLDLPPKLLLTGFKSCLTSLCLRDVNVTHEFFDYLPHSCPFLETLCIQHSRCLTRVTGSLHVKQLEVSYCKNLKKIDVSAQNLNSLILYCLFPIELRIVGAPSLVNMSIGSQEILHYVFDRLSVIFSQLVHLNLRIDQALHFTGELMNGVAMPNLQHLELQVWHARPNSSLYKCISVLAESRNLQKLTLKLQHLHTRKRRDREVHKWEVGYGFPLRRLKTLEVVGYRGKPVDFELVSFVLENASILEKFIVDFVPMKDMKKQRRLEMLMNPEVLMKLPRGVKLTVSKHVFWR